MWWKLAGLGALSAFLVAALLMPFPAPLTLRVPAPGQPIEAQDALVLAAALLTLAAVPVAFLWIGLTAVRAIRHRNS